MMKTVYKAANAEKAQHNLNRLKQKWGKLYPMVKEI